MNPSTPLGEGRAPSLGTRKLAISPSFVVPFVMINIGAALSILTGNFWLLQLLGMTMTVYGLYVCYLMLDGLKNSRSKRTTSRGRTCTA
jgi:lipoprotein signal peptidase